MTQNVQVLVKSKDSNSESIITYRAYLELQRSVDLVGQVDDDGNLIPGDPNLQPRHRKGASVNVTVNDEGKVPEWPPAPTANVSLQQPSPTSAETFHVERSLVISEENQPESEETETDGAVQSAPGEPIKERKKPGPKPKNKEA